MSRLRPSDTSRPVVSREHERDRTVVFDAYAHVCSKAARAGLYSALAKSLDEREVQLLGTFWISRFEEARPAAAARVREQRELRDDQGRALDVCQAEVHLSGLIREHAQVDNLVREPAHGGFIVI